MLLDILMLKQERFRSSYYPLLYTRFSDTYDCARLGLAQGQLLANSSYKGLAQKNGVLNLMVRGTELTRLIQVCSLAEDVRVEARFRLDEHGRVCVAADLSTRVDLECHLCNEPVAWPMQIAFEAVVAFNERQAEEWSEWSAPSSSKTEHIVVAAGQYVDVAELIEDELILGLPRQVCFDQQCKNMPELHFADNDSEALGTVPSDRQMPFKGLKELVASSGLVKGSTDQDMNN